MKALLSLIALIIGLTVYYYASMEGLQSPDKIRNEYLRSHSDGDIHIKAVWPTSAHGPGYRQGIELALDEIKAQGGIQCKGPQCKPRQIAFEYLEENGLSKEESVAQAHRLARDKNLIAVLGYSSSKGAIPASVVYERHGVVMLSSGATNLNLTRHNFYYVFRNITHDKSNAEHLVDYIEHEGYFQASVIYERGDYGTDFSNYFKHFASDRDITINTSLSYNSWDTNYLPMLAKLKEQEAELDVVLELSRIEAREYLLEQEGYANVLLASGSADELIAMLATLRRFSSAEEVRQTLENASVEQLKTYLRRGLEAMKSRDSLTELTERFHADYAKLTHKQLEEKLQLNSQRFAALSDNLQQQIADVTASLKAVPKSETSRIIALNQQKTALKNEYLEAVKLANRLARLQSGDVHILFVAGTVPGVDAVIRQAREMQIDTTIIGGDSLASLEQTFPEGCDLEVDCPDYGDVLTFAIHDIAEDKEEHQAFVNAYQEKFDKVPDVWALQGYDAMMIMAEAMRESKSIEPFVVATSLRYMSGFANHRHGGESQRRLFNRDGDIYVDKVEMLRLVGKEYKSVKDYK
jgi:ABC-type branched-subunit amino acid transport system substrate-binding protein